LFVRRDERSIMGLRSYFWPIIICFLILGGCGGERKPAPGTVLDEARQENRAVSSFPAADEDYYHDMDGGIPLSADEIKGRDMWLVWTGGNDRLWDEMTVKSVGTFDLLKTISSYPGLKANRENRWNYLGLVNEPCYKKAIAPDPNRYGLWLDTRDPGCGPEPF